MGELIATLGARIVDAGLAASLLTGLVVLAMVSTRQPSRRRALARAGVIGSLLAVPLVNIRPLAPIELIEPIRTAVGPMGAWIGAEIGIVPGPGLPGWHGPPRWIVDRLLGGLLLAYLAGIGIGLGRLALGWWGLGWIGRKASMPTPEVIALYEGLPYVVGRDRPRLRISSRTKGPVLLGVVRPTILIPPNLEGPGSADRLRLALLHELAHAEASDPWFGLAAELAAVFWFALPPLWWIRRQMRLDQEFLADRAASEGIGAARDYASTLVEIAATSGNADEGPSARRARGTGAVSPLFQRVLMLLRCPFPVEARPPRWWRGMLAGAAIVAVPICTALTLHATTTVALPAPEPPTRSLRVPRVLLTDSATTDAATVLPIRVRDRFTLSFEVHAATTELGSIRVMGHPLAEHPVVEAPHLIDPPRWHRVRLERLQGRMALSLDLAPPIRLHDLTTDEWITLRGVPGRTTTIQDLRMIW